MQRTPPASIFAVHLSFEALGRLLAEGKHSRMEDLEGHSRSVPGVSLLYHGHCAEVNPPPRPRSGKRRIPVAGCVVHTILREAAAAD